MEWLWSSNEILHFNHLAQCLIFWFLLLLPPLLLLPLYYHYSELTETTYTFPAVFYSDTPSFLRYSSFPIFSPLYLNHQNHVVKHSPKSCRVHLSVHQISIACVTQRTLFSLQWISHLVSNRMCTNNDVHICEYFLWDFIVLLLINLGKGDLKISSSQSNRKMRILWRTAMNIWFPEN